MGEIKLLIDYRSYPLQLCPSRHQPIAPRFMRIIIIFYRNVSSFSTLHTSSGMEKIILTIFEPTNSAPMGYEIIDFVTVLGIRVFY